LRSTRLRRFLVAAGCALVLAAVLAPAAVDAGRRLRSDRRRAELRALYRAAADPTADRASLLLRLSALTPGEEEESKAEADSPGAFEAEQDDALRRMVMRRLRDGVPTPEVLGEQQRIASAEALRWAHLLPSPVHAGGPDRTLPNGPLRTAESWVPLGPTSARFAYNGVEYQQVDSGRVTGIAVHPTVPSTVYVSFSGGGLWKSVDFGGPADPTWTPLTEAIGNLAIGALAMDPTAPDTLYIGTGDPFDQAGGHILKTTNGGITWSAPVQLSGAYPPFEAGTNPSPRPVTATRIRTIRVDPANPAIVLVGTDVGLFRSGDGGASFGLNPLYNATGPAMESIWSIAWLGSLPSQPSSSRFVISGIKARADELPPEPGFETTLTPGELWFSVNSGLSWTSLRANNGLPTTSVGRITLAAAAPAPDPGATVVYATVADANGGHSGRGQWRSTSGGQSFVAMGSDLSNPTFSTDCRTADVLRDQAFYNQAIAVDPLDAARVLVGGMLCAIRTRNGLSVQPSWENVAHWLPASGDGATSAGVLPHVHADWHQIAIVRLPGGGYRVLAGGDGGLFFSEDVFDPQSVNDATVHWRSANRGLVTHLSYSVASGDPALGNPSLVYSGMQDNGTRLRDSTAQPTVFNQVIGGDGFGAAAHVAGSPPSTMWWASANGQHRACSPDEEDCSRGGSWSTYPPDPSFCFGDALPFFTRYAAVTTATQAPTFLSYTLRQVVQIAGSPSFAAWGALSPCLGTGEVFDGEVVSSPTVSGLHGVGVFPARVMFTVNCTPNAPRPCTWLRSAAVGADVDGNGFVTADETVERVSSLSFFPGAAPPGELFAVSSSSLFTAARTPISPALGHLFLSIDGGRTFVRRHGNGTGQDLPNVPIHVVRFDPTDPLGETLYAGTDLGVYRSVDRGQTWHRYGRGMPLVKVTDLFVSSTSALMRAATYGRGLWEIYPSAAEHGVPGNGDFDRNLQLDAFDLGAMARRLGTSTLSPSLPPYDWNLNVTGTGNAIDEADLTVLLNRLGTNP
jgi:hypothetical protein